MKLLVILSTFVSAYFQMLLYYFALLTWLRAALLFPTPSGNKELLLSLLKIMLLGCLGSNA